MENMKQSSRHFFRSLDSTFHRVPLEEDSSICDESKNPIGITLQLTDYWGGIMGDKDSSAGVPVDPCVKKQHQIIDSIEKTLSSSDESFLSSPLTKLEMKEVTKCMCGHSSPGMDQLPAAFYQFASSVFRECFQVVFDNQLRRGSLLRSQRSSAITLLYEKGY
uniref:AlNc14C60G4413 protein n=1 Tax=Albugo laibachii Nc14 TaxID=890382 RepID=F0WCM9_9STRA|nr:AlNc14C60G4413 [Albugo laibachii Nc14]|eukprot:CCA18950.1 AlNc14C60G4413 [Albugo laibachii Nc14]